MNGAKRREQEAVVADLERQLSSLCSQLWTVPEGDLKAVLLREGISATLYRLDVERAELAAPDYDRRFLSRNRPKGGAL